MYSEILIPLDGSKTAEKVLPHARFLADKLKLPVNLLTIIDIVEMGLHTGAEKPWLIDRIVEEGKRAGENYLGQIAATFPPGTSVSVTVEIGRPAEAIIEKGGRDKAILIAMATHGRSGLDRFLLGSVAEKVLRGAVNPLLLVRAREEVVAEPEAAFKTVLVPLDGSAVAESVLPTIVDVAKKLDSTLVLFRAYHLPPTVYAGDEAPYLEAYADLLPMLRDEAVAYLEKKAAEVRKLGLEKVSIAAEEGFAADEILAFARKAGVGLIAMGSHGRSGVQRWLLGSVTETVVRHATSPVLVARGA